MKIKKSIKIEKSIMTLIKSDYKNRNINLTELAEKIGISRGTLDRLHKFESCSHETKF